MTEKFLNKAYQIDTDDGARALYQDWAPTYDAEMAEDGYVTPDRCARVLAHLCPSKDAVVLDYGCGTGLSGDALRKVGFQAVDGTDPAEEMLRIATERRCYRSVFILPPNGIDAAALNKYNAVVSVGVFGPGHASAQCLIQIAMSLKPLAYFVFSLNDATRNSPAYQTALCKLKACPELALVHCELGDHLPAQDVGATVCAFRRNAI